MSTPMTHKMKIAGWIAIGAVAGALTTVQFQAVARNTLAPLPLEELQQLAAVFAINVHHDHQRVVGVPDVSLRESAGVGADVNF